MLSDADPSARCRLCPRLAAYRDSVALREPDWYNGAVPSFGDVTGRLAVVGLAPGVSGANRTGRPFTGDHAGSLLYATLARHGFSEGHFQADPADGLVLKDCLVTNAVRCAPPQNRPIGNEISTCRQFLFAQLMAMTNLIAVIALGRIAHESVVRALGSTPRATPFSHHSIGQVGKITVFGSYHCSRYNTNTGRLTQAMFDAVFSDVAAFVRQHPEKT